MGTQRVTPTKGMEGDRQSSANSASQPESPIAKLQEVLGNRAGSDRFKADLDRYQQLGSKDGAHPLDALLTSVGAARPAKTKPQFRGLSHELQANPSSSGMVVQAKMTVRPAGDRYEQEADRMAAQVVKQIHSSPVSSTNQSDATQSPVHAEAFQPKAIQPKGIQSGVSAEGGVAVTPELEASISRARSGGQPLPNSAREQMEQAFGADFSGVRVHTDRRSNELNRSIQAQAFTTGQNIFFQQGMYEPQSQQGQTLIAHELTHVVQQTHASTSDLGSRHGDNSRTIQMQNTITDNVRVPDDLQAMIYRQLPIRSLLSLRSTSKAQRQQIDNFIHNFIYSSRLHIEQHPSIILSIIRSKIPKFSVIPEAVWQGFLTLLGSLEREPSNLLALLEKSRMNISEFIDEDLSTAICSIGEQKVFQEPEIYAAIGIFKASGTLRKGPGKNDSAIEEGQYEEGRICRIVEINPTRSGKSPDFVQGAQKDWMKVSITTKKGKRISGYVLKSDVDCNWAEYRNINPEIPILPSKPQAEDVKQGLIGDCFLQAALIAIAEKQPQKILELFSSSTDLTEPLGTKPITIQFYRKKLDYPNPPTFICESVTINPTLPVLNRQIVGTKRVWQKGERVYAQGPAIWPALIEKAYAKWKDGYARIDGGSVAECLTSLLGQEYKQISIDPAAAEDLPQGKKPDRYSKQLRKTYDAIVSALHDGEVVCLGTHQQWEDLKGNREGHSAGEPMWKGMVAQHAYSIIDVYQKKNGKLYLLVRNPWGKYGTVKKKQFGFSKRVVEEGEQGAISHIELSMLPKFFESLYIVDKRATALEEARKSNL